MVEPLRATGITLGSSQVSIRDSRAISRKLQVSHSMSSGIYRSLEANDPSISRFNTIHIVTCSTFYPNPTACPLLLEIGDRKGRMTRSDSGVKVKCSFVVYVSWAAPPRESEHVRRPIGVSYLPHSKTRMARPLVYVSLRRRQCEGRSNRFGKQAEKSINQSENLQSNTFLST